MVELLGENAIEDISVSHPTELWEADFCDVFGGPTELRYEGSVLLRNHRFYVDDLDNQYAVTKKQRHFHKGGCAVVASEGYFPFGTELNFSQTCRFAMNHFRVTFDLKWLPGTKIKRHMGLGNLELPGKFVRYWCLDPVLHQIEGKQTGWFDLPEASDERKMVGHWHRPPLAIVFERADGVLIEVGTGSDVWRWEENFGAGPEQGSYKIFLSNAGIEYVREPLMTCAEFVPSARPYRFTWYVAWGKKGTTVSVASAEKEICFEHGEPIIPLESEAYVVNFAALSGKENLHHLHCNGHFAELKEDSQVCWECDGVQKCARRMIRKLQSLPLEANQVKTLRIKGISPSYCLNSIHMERGDKPMLIHWDINAILDFLVWAKQQLGSQWCIVPEISEEMPLVSLTEAVKPLGFSLQEAE